MKDKYYKNNAQLRYQLSKELDIYKQKREESERNKPNPITLPLYTSILAVSTTIAAYLAERSEYGIKAFWLVLCIAALLAVFHAVAIFIYTPAKSFMKREIKHFISVNKDASKELSNNQRKQLLARFDFDITGLIYLSYIIATDTTTEDEVLKEYNRGETLFYIDRAIRKLQKVFTDNVKYVPKIYPYRIKNNMDLLGAAIIHIAKDKISNSDLNAHIQTTISQFNYIGQVINNKYQKEIVTLLDES